MNAGILLSLEYLEVEFQKWKTKNSVFVEHSVNELYTGLCVLENQSWVSISVLSRLWQLEKDVAFDVANLFCGMSLATLQLRQTSGGTEEAGIVLHDLLLDFCQRQARKMMNSSLWHIRLLNGYLETQHESPRAPEIQSTLLCAPRPWWSESDDGYIHANLARHLSCSGHSKELGALLLDARWTSLRVEIGGILALKTDFAVLDKSLAQKETTWDQNLSLSEIRRGFKCVLRAVQASFGTRVAEGQRTFQFQVCGRLRNSREDSAIVDAYLKSVQEHTPKPYLLPVSAFFPDLSTTPIMEIRVGRRGHYLACSPCERYVAVGAGKEVVLAEIATGEILQRLLGHTANIWCMSFLAGSKRIVSGSNDRMIFVWEWEFSDAPVQVLEGHTHNITGIAVSGNGERILSSSLDKTLRIWDVSTGTQVGELLQSCGVNCVSVCANDKKIAIGLSDGTLKVLDYFTEEVLFEDTKAHEISVRCVAFCPNGLYLATGSRDKTVGIWNVQTWRRMGDRLKGHELIVQDIAFSPCGKQLASSSDDGTVRLWDVDLDSACGYHRKSLK